MKLKNVNKGDLLYLKTFEEACQSKHFSHIDENDCVHFKGDTAWFSKNLDSKSAGKVVKVLRIIRDGDVIYDAVDGRVGVVSYRAFRKPKPKEMKEYEERQQ